MSETEFRRLERGANEWSSDPLIYRAIKVSSNKLLPWGSAGPVLTLPDILMFQKKWGICIFKLNILFFKYFDQINKLLYVGHHDSSSKAPGGHILLVFVNITMLVNKNLSI